MGQKKSIKPLVSSNPDWELVDKINEIIKKINYLEILITKEDKS